MKLRYIDSRQDELERGITMKLRLFPTGPVQALFSNWLSLGRNLLDMIVVIFPSPLEITGEKVEKLISRKIKPFKSLPKETQSLKLGKIKISSVKI